MAKMVDTHAPIDTVSKYGDLLLVTDTSDANDSNDRKTAIGRDFSKRSPPKHGGWTQDDGI